MALTYNIERDIRYNQGLEKATVDRNTTIARNLLLHTAHSIEEIAKLVSVSVEFVSQIKSDINNS